MKRAVFILKTIVSPWKPPFTKKIGIEDYDVTVGQEFDTIEREPKKIFKLVKCNAETCLVEFSEKFTLKGHEHPGNRQIEIGSDPTSFSYLWGEDGITKKLSLKQIYES